MLTKGTEVAEDSLTLFLTTNILINNLLLGSISLVWGFVNSLQIAAHMQLLNVIMPGNVSIVYEMIYMIATFDLIPMDVVIEYV